MPVDVPLWRCRGNGVFRVAGAAQKYPSGNSRCSVESKGHPLKSFGLALRLPWLKGLGVLSTPRCCFGG